MPKVDMQQVILMCRYSLKVRSYRDPPSLSPVYVQTCTFTHGTAQSFLGSLRGTLSHVLGECGFRD